jgi:hypothetical protein
VGTVDHNNRTVLRSVTLGRDMGSTAEVVSGLSPDDMVITNPPDSLIDGEEVRIVETNQGPAGTPAPNADY